MKAIFNVAGAIALGAVFASPLSTKVSAEDLTIERLVSSPSLFGPSVQGMRLSPDGKRITFLRGKETKSNQLDLWEFNAVTGESTLLVDSAELLGGVEEVLSEEEKARRERARSAGRSGIVTYFWSKDGKQLLFPLGGDIYVLPLGGTLKQLTATPQFETDIRFSPKGTYVSFIRDREIYAVDVASGEEKRLTFDASETVANGMAEFAAQEELARFTGYWWSPDEMKIAFEQFDEKSVSLKTRSDIQSDGTVVSRLQRYPEAGGTNVEWRVGIVDVTSGSIVWPALPGGSMSDRDDYLARVHWLKESNDLVIEQLSRDQLSLNYVVRGADGSVKGNETALQIRNDTWVNLYNDFWPVGDGKVLITRDWDMGETGHFRHILTLDTKNWTLEPLTSGDWVVSGIQKVDKDAGLVYFTGFKDTPVEQHLYSIPLKGGAVKRITIESGWHSVTVGDDIYIDRFSSVTHPPEVSIRSLNNGTLKSYVQANKLKADHPYFDYAAGAPTEEIGTLKAADGVTDLYYRLYLPANMKAGQKYPTVMAPYGGPHGQRVRNAWSVDFNQILARNGFVVMVLDNRGSWNRGLAFEAHLKNKMGRPEIADQVAGVNWLVEKGLTDPERVGIWGWSYGGFMTLMGLFTAEDTFKAGVAVAPVTDWRLYDTAYTERYLSHPEADGTVYEDSSVFKYADRFKGNLLLIHGMSDDNVFFDNSVKLMSVLQNSGKDFELMTYPGKKHGIRGKNTRMHLWTKALDFFERKLK